jgi:aryl-alcohol dehydrogenase-like predicted oxidoreductase
MVSEFISGGDPIRTPNYKHLDLALEMGLNYLDMAPAYGDGDCEIAYGRFLGGTAKRDKVFLQTKVSAFGNVRNRMYRDIFKGLPGEKQVAIMTKVAELRRNNIAEQPGYYLDYFPGQRDQFPGAYLSAAMMPEYAGQVEGSQEFRRTITESLEGSLKRVGTDHFDLLMCPHGANLGEELNNPHIYETFLELRKQGKVRFLGATSHNAAGETARRAAELGHVDAVQIAYNVINGGYVEQSIREASAHGVGIIAMKAAHAVATHHKSLQPVPQWRIDKIDRLIPGDMKPPMKAYLWVLQNPHVTAINSNLWDETFIRENLSLAGRKQSCTRRKPYKIHPLSSASGVRTAETNLGSAGWTARAAVTESRAGTKSIIVRITT